MKRVGALLLCLFALAGGAAPAREPAAAPQKRILMLYAYGYGGRGVELFNDGFFKALTDAGFPVGNVHAEYLDLQRNRDNPGYRTALLAMLRKKYADRPVGLVVTIQQPALEFLLAEGKDLAPGAPVIAIQQRPLLEHEKAGRHIVGEVNQFDIRGTLERALELFPGTRRVVFAAGSSPADRKVAELAMAAAEPWRTRLEAETTVGMTLPAILDRVAHLPAHSVVIFTQYNVDSAGRVALAYEAEKLIVEAANAPVFGFYDYNLRNGGIGGSVLAVEASGVRTARLALAILAGADRSAAGVLQAPEHIPMFDWRQIERWGGDPGRLPAGTVFVNRPPSVWREYRGVIAAILAFIGVQFALIVVLAANIRRRRHAERGRAASEERFRRLFEEAPLPLAFVQRDGTVADLNARFVQVFGYTRQDIPTLAEWWARAYPDPAYRQRVVDAWSAAVAKAAASGSDIEPVEYRVSCKDGTQRVMIVSGIVLGEDFLATFFDVTERQRAEQALVVSQAAALEEQTTARLAALNLMEDAVAERRRAEASEAELRRRNEELERFNSAMVGRELEMVALKRQVNELARQLGREAPFDLSFAEAPAGEGP